MTFPPVRHEGCFPELWGFVLLDPARLDAAVGGATGRDLLRLFEETDTGDQLARDGVLLPVFDIPAGYYTVVVRHHSDRPTWSPPGTSSPGGVLGTETGALLLCGVGHLVEWNPAHPKHRPVTVPAGWYRVEVRGYLFEGTGDDGGYEFILTPHAPATPIG